MAEKIKLSGVPETMLQTVYARAKESTGRGVIQDKKALEIIDELEPTKRGLYGGTVGYLGFDGNIDTCIAIRTVLFKNNRAYVQAGGGIVADSVPEKEFEESENKARAVINAIEQACNL